MSASRRKGNRLESFVMPLLLAADGACPVLGGLATSTGRLGHLNELQIDGATRRLAVECKNRESTGDWLFNLVTQTAARASRFDKRGAVVLKKNLREPIVVMALPDFLAILKGES